MNITRSGLDTDKGPAEWFTGDVYIDPIAAAPAPARVRGNLVRFTPGLAPLGTRTRSARPSTSPKGSGSASGAAARSR